MSCAICGIRKEKRFCPAVHGRICPQCCGEQREITLDCPSECMYLQQAREHDRSRPLEDVDPSALFSQVEVRQQFVYEHEHLIVGLSFAMAKSTRSDRTLADPDLIASLSSLAKSYETLANSGLHYETPLPNVRQQAIVAELQSMLREYRDTEQKHLGYTRLREADVLRALVFLVRMAYSRTSGRPKSRAFIDFLQAQFPENKSPINAANEAESRIIVP